MKYRIKKVNWTDGDVTYVVQKKFLWWWRDMSFKECCYYCVIHSANFWNIDNDVRDFTSQETAKKIIDWLKYGPATGVLIDRDDHTVLYTFPKQGYSYQIVHAHPNLETAKMMYNEECRRLQRQQELMSVREKSTEIVEIV